MASREQWEATIRALWDGATHREQWYAAIALARHRPYRAWVDSDAMPLWESLIRAGAWWDVVDDIATHLVRDTVLAAPDGRGAAHAGVGRLGLALGAPGRDHLPGRRTRTPRPVSS